MTELALQLRRLVAGRTTAVVGVGNRLRGDDGVGSRVAESLSERSATWTFDAETVPENYLGTLLAIAPEVVVFIDAADHGAQAGAVCIARTGELIGRGASTHTASLALLGKALGARGIDCWLVGIQPGATAFGCSMTVAVADAAAELVDALAAALDATEVVS